MKEFIKKNFILLLAFLLPVVLIVVIALSTYLPSLFISTKYNFVYTSCSDSSSNYYYPYYCNNYLQQRYAVINNKIATNPIDMTQDLDKNGVPDFNENYIARIFLHDTEKNESREITLAEAQTLTLNNLLTSPDGVTVSRNYNYNGGGDFFIFGGGGHSSFGYYLTKGNSKKKVNLINTTDQYYYQNNFQFIGWVLPGRN